MDWQITSYVVGLVVAALLSLRAAAFAYRHRDRPGGLYLALATLAIAQWAGAYICEANAVTLSLKVLWSTVAYLGTLTCAPLLLHVAADFTDQRHLLRSTAARLAVWAIPAISLALVTTNQWHGLIWNEFAFTDASQRVLIYGRGAFWWVMLTHQYTLLVATTVIFVGSALRWRHIYRTQSMTMLLSFVSPWIISAIYVFRPTLLGTVDWTPVGFAISGIVLSVGFQRLHLLDLIPVARDRVVESMQDGVVVLDPRGRIVDINPAARDWVGERNLIGQSAASVFARWTDVTRGPDIAVSNAPPFWQTSTRGQFVIDRQGTFEWYIAPLKSGPTGPQGYLVLLRDVTEQRRAEESLRGINALLEEQVEGRTAQILAEKERSDAILRSVSDGVVVFDDALHIRYANPAFSAMTGYGATEFLGRPVIEALGNDVERQLAIARVTQTAWQGEAQARRKDGRALDLTLSISPMHDPEHATSVYVCTLHDVSQSRDLDRARKRFLDNISHQLRTPITTLKLYAHLLSKAELTEKQRKNLQVIDEQADWLQHLVEDILEMASLDSGRTMAMWESVAIRTIIDHLSTRYQARAEQAGLQLNILAKSADLPDIRGDQNRLIQAVAELVDNAVRFTPPGGAVNVTADINAEGSREWLTITVKDSGPGIPQDERSRIFERFYRGQIADTGQLPGTGLGLPIANAIVEAHGGHIDLDSSEEGTAFTIRLPVVRELSAA